MRKSLLVSGFLVCSILVICSYASAYIDWYTMQPMNEGRMSLATCTLDGKIYALGGHRGYGGYLNSAEVYDPVANQWSYLPNMSVARTYGTCEGYGGKVYVFGGSPGGGATDTVEQYDPATGNWVFKAPLPFNRTDSASVVMNNEIYVIGGETYGGGGYPRGTIPSVDIYNPDTNTWRAGVPLPEGRVGHRAVVLDGKIYVMGAYGQGGASGPFLDMVIFDPQTGAWAPGPQMQTPRFYFGAIVLNGKIYVFGGDTVVPWATPLNSIEVFDPATNRWEYDDSTLTSFRVRLGAVNLSNSFYLIGGNAFEGSNQQLSLVEKGAPRQGSAAVINLPKTGQLKCYDSSGNEIGCAGTRQDGHIRNGVDWPQPRFSVSGDCVTDMLTGLVWMKNVPTTPLTWSEALTYANDLNLCGHSDWRLPNINELESLVNYGEADTAVWLNGQGFSNVQADWHWSSDSWVYKGTGWRVNMANGNALETDKPQRNLAWPVRAGQQSAPDSSYPANVWKTGQLKCYDSSGSQINCSGTGQDGDIRAGVQWPYPRFTVDGDCVTDNLTGLMWVRSPDTSHRSWSDAMASAGNVSLCGYSNWRLPNVIELRSLLNYNRHDLAFPEDYPFESEHHGDFWTSTTVTGSANKAWSVNVSSGSINNDFPKASSDSPAWPVRSLNQCPAPDAGPNVAILSEAQSALVVHGNASDSDNDTLECMWAKGDTELASWQPIGANGACPLNLSFLPPFPPGEHALTLKVRDGKCTATDEMILTVNNSAPHPSPTGQGVFQINTPVTLGGQVSDYDGDMVAYQWLEGSNVLFSGHAQTVYQGSPVDLPQHVLFALGLGDHTISLCVRDGINAAVCKNVTIIIIDTAVPTLAPVPNATILWPPNHKMVNITIAANAKDNSGLPVTLAATVASNEPEDGLGDGDTAPDWTQPAIDQSNGIIFLQLRAERSGKGSGRIYTITIVATDTSNNSSQAKVEIIVPHDQRSK